MRFQHWCVCVRNLLHERKWKPYPSKQSPTFPNHGLAHNHGLADVRRPYIQLYWLVQSKHMYVPRHVNLTWNVASTTIHAFSIMDRGATPRQFMNGHAGCHCEDQLVRDFIWARVRWLHCYVLCCAPYICPEACFAQEENAGLFLQPTVKWWWQGPLSTRLPKARPFHWPTSLWVFLSKKISVIVVLSKQILISLVDFGYNCLVFHEKTHKPTNSLTLLEKPHKPRINHLTIQKMQTTPTSINQTKKKKLPPPPPETNTINRRIMRAEQTLCSP